MSTATIDYNSAGFVTDTIDANGNKVVYSGVPSTSNATRVQVEDPSGNVVFQYDKYFDSRMSETKMVNGAGQTVYTNTYGSANTPYGLSGYSDASGTSWSATRDQFGHLLMVTSPKNVTITRTYTYSPFTLGELASEKQGSRTPTSYTYYEPNGLLYTISTAVPGQSGTGSTQTSTYSYDSIGNITSIVSPGNNATTAHSVTFGYTTDGSYSQSEALGEPITVADGLGKVRHMRYDSRGNGVTATDASGNTTQYTYNLADQLSLVILPATGNTGSGTGSRAFTRLFVGGPTSQFLSYDESGSLVRSVGYTYGQEGELLARSGAGESASYTYTFDPLGNVNQRFDSAGNSISTSTIDAYGYEQATGSPSDPYAYKGSLGILSRPRESTLPLRLPLL